MENLMTNAQFNDLVKQVKIVPNNFTNQFALEAVLNVDEVLTQLCSYWRIAKPVLRFAKIITPPKIDKAIDEILVIVDKLCSNPSEGEKSELLEKFAMIWGTVKPLLEAAKSFTGPKADKIFDEIIKIGDLLSKS